MPASSSAQPLAHPVGSSSTSAPAQHAHPLSNTQPPAQPPTDFKLSCYRRATEAKDTLKANTNGDGNSDLLKEGSCAVNTVTAGIVVRKNLQTTSQGRWAFPCIKALRQLQEYTFEVQAQNDVSFGIFSSTKMLKTIGTTKPGRPRVPTVVNTTGGSILLKFLAPEDQGGSGYDSLIYQLQMSNNTMQEWSSFQDIGRHSDDGYPDWARKDNMQRVVALPGGSALTEQTQYRFRVRAKSQGDVSIKILKIVITDAIAVVYHDELPEIKLFKGTKVSISGFDWETFRAQLVAEDGTSKCDWENCEELKFGNCNDDMAEKCNHANDCTTGGCNKWVMNPTVGSKFGFNYTAANYGVKGGRESIHGVNDPVDFPVPTRVSFSILA